MSTDLGVNQLSMKEIGLHLPRGNNNRETHFLSDMSITSTTQTCCFAISIISPYLLVINVSSR